MFSIPFKYDPSTGLNLLINMTASGLVAANSYFDARNGDAHGLLSRAFTPGGGGTGFSGWGLVTGIVISSSAQAETFYRFTGFTDHLRLARLSSVGPTIQGTHTIVYGD